MGELNIEDYQVFGDSWIVIQKMQIIQASRGKSDWESAKKNIGIHFGYFKSLNLPC